MIDLAGYVATDRFFGAPYLDMDTEVDEPVPHRHVRGGFEGTDTRFRLYFPPADRWEGRMFNPLSGAHGGDDGFFGAPMGEVYGGLAMCAATATATCRRSTGGSRTLLRPASS